MLRNHETPQPSSNLISIHVLLSHILYKSWAQFRIYKNPRNILWLQSHCSQKIFGVLFEWPILNNITGGGSRGIVFMGGKYFCISSRRKLGNRVRKVENQVNFFIDSDRGYILWEWKRTFANKHSPKFAWTRGGIFEIFSLLFKIA